MNRNIVGLDIGTTAVRAAEVSTRRSPAVLERFGEVSLPLGAVIDGEVEDVEAVAAAIRQLWRNAKFTSKRIVLGVANQRVVVRLTDLPWMETAELRSSLKFQVQEYIPIPVDEAELDFNILGELEAADGQRLMRVLLVAAQKDMVQGHVQAVVRAGLRPVGVDLTPFALLRALAPTGTNSWAETGEALIDVGARVTNIVVHLAGSPRFVRILLMGSQDVLEALRETPTSPTAPVVDGSEGAEAGLTDFGTESDSSGTWAQEIAGSRINERKITTFIEEIRGSLDFYRSQLDSVPIERVILTGGGSRLDGLADRLATVLRLPVEPGRSLISVRPGNLKLSPEQLAELESTAAVAIGLALAGAS